MKEEAAEMVQAGGREVRVTHPDKAYFSKGTKLSKLDVVRYYLSVAPGALAGIRDRPIVLKRFVNGAEGEAFYQKRAPSERPAWLRTVTLSFPSGRTAEEVVVDDAAGLAWIVNLGCIELHPHPVRSGDLVHADRHGAVVIPVDVAAKLPEAAELMARREAVILDIARGSGFTIDKLKQAITRSDEIH